MFIIFMIKIKNQFQASQAGSGSFPGNSFDEGILVEYMGYCPIYDQ